MPPAARRHRFFHFFRTDGGALTLLVLIFFGANWPLLFNQASEIWDGEDMFAPYYRYIASLARSGHFLWWNPFSNAGSPDFAEPQYGAFSPVTLLFGLLTGPGPTGYHLYWLGMWLFGGVGMYVLARALTAPPWGALVTSLGFTFSGFYIGHAEHMSVVYTFSFVPWVLWRVRAAMLLGRWQPACEAGALWGLSAMAGNPAVHIPAGMFIGVVSLAWLPAAAPGQSRWAPWRTYTLVMGVLLAVGVLVLAPTYLGFRYEVAGYSHRTRPLPRSAVLDQGLGFSWLTALFTPVFVPFRAALPGWADFDVSLRPVYFGAALPVLAAFAVWRQRREGRTWAMLGAGLLFLGIAMGSTLPLRTWLYDLVPISRFFRHPPMFRGFFAVAVAMLAAPGTAFLDEYLRAADGRRLRPLAVIAGVAAVLAVASYVWMDLVATDEVADQLPPVGPFHLAVAWLGLAAVCVLAVQRAGFRRFVPSALVALTALDLVVAYVCTGHVAHQDKQATVATGPVYSQTDLAAVGLGRGLVAQHNENLYTRQPVFVCYTAMRNYDQEAWGKDRLLRQSVLGQQRLWFAAGVPTVSAAPGAFAAFDQRAHDLGALPVVRHTREGLLHPAEEPSPADRAAIAAAPAAQALDCQVLAYHDNDLALRVNAPTDGFLLVTDRWARSWTATVNGQPTPIDGGDFIFRLLPVHAGENLVAMRYKVPWFYPLLIVSWGTLAAAGTMAWRSRRRTSEAADLAPARESLTPLQTVAV